jgi:hypothetical protein
MLDGNRIVLRKRIRDYEMITEFEKLSNLKLPNPPLDIPVEDHRLSLTWTMDMKKESSLKSYKKMLQLFNLPFKTNGASRLWFVMRRDCWWDVLFSVYDLEYQIRLRKNHASQKAT